MAMVAPRGDPRHRGAGWPGCPGSLAREPPGNRRVVTWREARLDGAAAQEPMEDQRASAAPPPERHVALPLLGIGGALLIDGSAGLLTLVFRELAPMALGLASVVGCFLLLAAAGSRRIVEVLRTA